MLEYNYNEVIRVASKKSKDTNKKIPIKNYIILAVVLILTIIAVIYLFMWNRVYEKNKLQT